jgi:hypothetical protein
MSLIRQIKDLKTEFVTIHSHVLRRVIQIHGCIPESADPKKPMRRTLLPGWLIIGGLPFTPYEAGADMPEQMEPEQLEDAIA